ncbi:TPA: L-lactate dehydrogenase [Pseudomonas aeruginosa]|nr:L-lactate dehydrogenase [Pseudomonas aeruginosa]HEQ1673409.1 L-lactate dehydrogenase [Pseudomonas aeruginosa]
MTQATATAVVHDLIGVGFGPSNIALAIALQERAQAQGALEVLFLDKQGDYRWHGNTLVSQSELQISFLKDLVSLRNPTSPYSFVNYLHKHDRLVDFINLGTFYPCRMEFNDYLRWVASHFQEQSRYGEEVLRIEPMLSAGQVEALRMFYDYADSGSWSEGTYRANQDDFAAIKLRQRVARNIENRSLRTRMLGQEMAMPVAIAPTGLAGMQHADGEILAARAAAEFGVRYTLSTMSICSLEDIATEVGQPFWFQLYVMRDRDFIERLIDRAKAAGCDALVLTLDLQIIGQRHKDLKNGLSAPPRPTLANLLNIATKPRWALGMLGTRRRGFGNIVGHVKGVDDMGSLSEWTARQFDPRLNWGDVEWIKRRWGGKLVLKGILDAEDARLAADSGADALVVSNHGGRQLDGAPSTISALPAIVEAVGERIEVWLDSGIRSGQDVLKAIALGARGTMIGRPYLYGLGALGQAGVTRALEIIARELDLTMAFCGHTDIREVGRDILLPGSYPR